MSGVALAEPDTQLRLASHFRSLRAASELRGVGMTAILELVPEIDTAQDNAGRSAFELHGKEFTSGALFDPIAQSHELCLALVWLAPRRAFQIIHGGGADRTGYLLLTVNH